MESESTSASSRSSDDGSFVLDDVTDNSDDEDDEQSSSFDDLDASPTEQYRNILDRISGNGICNPDQDVRFESRAVLCCLLEDMDRFSHELAGDQTPRNRCMNIFSLGDREGRDDDLQPLQMTEEWATFCRAISTLQSVNVLKIGGYSLNAQVIREVLRCDLPIRECIELSLPWHDQTRDDRRTLVEALSNHSCQNIKLELRGRDSADETASDSEILSRLLQVHGLKELTLASLCFSLGECRAIATSLTTDSCPLGTLSLTGCEFLDGGAKVISDAFKSNTRVKSFHVDQGYPLFGSLITSLPLNKSIKEVHISLGLDLTKTKEMIAFFKDVAQNNTTMKDIRVSCHLYAYISITMALSEIEGALQENCTVEHVDIRGI